MDERAYYTVEEVQRIVGCSRTKIYQIIAAPTFPKMKLGRLYYIDKEEFAKWRKRNLYSSVGVLR